MVTTSILNGAAQQQHFSILIHYSLSDKTFVCDTLAPKMISDLTPSEESSATLLLQNEKKRQICFQQQSGTKSNSDGKCIEKNLMNSESVIVVASEHYIKINNNNNELKTITEKVCCSGGNKKPLVVIALDSSIAQTLRHTTSLKASNILVWGSPNFWQNVSRNLMTKYQTFNNNKLHNLSSSPNKKKLMGSDDDDEIWTYLKTNSENNSSRKHNDFSSDNRLSMGTLKENLNNMRTVTNGHQNTEDKSYSFNFPSSTLQLGKRKQYLRGNPIPSSTPTSRRTSHPDSSESTSSMSKARPSKVENQHSLFHPRNVLENPFESHNRFAHRKPPPYPITTTTTTTQGIQNSNSDSDYMSVNDSLAPRNEPIYHTLDDEQQTKSFRTTTKDHDDPCDDQKVYINSALEVVYPTASLLRKQQQQRSDAIEGSRYFYISKEVPSLADLVAQSSWAQLNNPRLLSR